MSDASNRKGLVGTWLVRCGLLLFIIGLVLMSPLADLLPVDWWGTVASWFGTPETVAYVRVGPAGPNWSIGSLVFFAGAACTLLGRLLKAKS